MPKAQSTNEGEVAGNEALESYVQRLASSVQEISELVSGVKISYNSGHEAYAVMLKHVGALWSFILADGGVRFISYRAAQNIAAVAALYMTDIVTAHWLVSGAQTREIRIQQSLHDIGDELLKARKKFPPFNSPEEGYAVLLEEFEELWDEIKHNKDFTEDAYNEAKQVGAMALSFMLDCWKVEERIED